MSDISAQAQIDYQAEMARLLAELAILRAQIDKGPGYRVVQRPTKPIFLAADIADAYVDEEEDVD